MGAAMTIEAVRPDQHELEEVRALLRRANEQYRAALHPAAFDPYLDMVLDVEARLDSSVLLGVRHGPDLIGTVAYYPDARLEGWGADHGEAGIRAMAIDPDHRGAGLGRTLVEACAERAEAEGAAAVTLHTAEWLPEAIRLYERCGFVRDPQRDLWASELMAVPDQHDYLAMAFRLELAQRS